MVFPNYRAVFAFDAFAGHAWPHHFGQAINIHSIDARIGFNFLAHGLGPRFCAKDTELQAALFGIQTLAFKLLNNHLHVAGCAHDDAGLKVGDQLHLLFGLPARHGNGGCTHAFYTIVRSQAAREEPIAISHMHQIAGPSAGSAYRPCHQVRPRIDVLQGIAHHSRLSSCAGRCMDTRHLLTRYCEHAKGIVGAQVLLGGEWEFCQIGQRFQVAGMHTCVIKRFFVMRHLVVGMLQRLLQARQLQRLKFIFAGTFNGF